MTKKSKPKIVDNPSVKEMKDVLPAIRALGKVSGFLGGLGIKQEELLKFSEQAKELEAQAKILDLPDRFNELFSAKGWICVNSAMSVEVMEAAIAFAEAGDFDEAEQALVDWFTEDNIRLFAITRARRFHQARLRDEQLREALNLYLEERYMAAVPLILIACDGLASDVSGVSPFAEKADLSVYDSVTAHSTGLPTLIDLLRKGWQKSRDDELCLPERHKILHGRALGYANKIVAAKAWLLMMALVDWAIDKTSERERHDEAERKANVSFRNSLKQYQKVQDDKREMSSFEPYEEKAPFSDPFDEGSALEAVSEFLEGWKSKNFGKMAKFAVNLTSKPINKMAGEMRGMTELVELEGYEIRKIRYSTIARSDVRVWLKAKTHLGNHHGELDFLVIRYTADGDVAMPNDQGTWAIQQAVVYKAMHGEFIE